LYAGGPTWFLRVHVAITASSKRGLESREVRVMRGWWREQLPIAHHYSTKVSYLHLRTEVARHFIVLLFKM